MKIYRAIVAIIVLLLPIISVAQNKPEVTLYDVRKADGTHEVFKITTKKASILPVWSPENRTTAPITTDKAISLSKAWANKQYINFESYDVNSIKLLRINWPELNDRWYYLIEFTQRIKGYGSSGSYLFVVVLMDGSIVAPQKD